MKATTTNKYRGYFRLSAFGLFLLALPAAAQTRTWNGSNNSFWSNASNWNEGSFTNGADVIFPAGAGNRNNALGGGRSVQSITIASGAASYRIGTSDNNSGSSDGRTLTFRDNGTLTIEAGNVSNHSIGLNLNNANVGSISLSGNFTVNHQGTGVFSFTRPVTGSGNLTKSGGGELVFTAANTYGGATAINNGTLRLGNGGNAGSLSTSSAISVSGNGILEIRRNNAVVQGTDFSGSAITGTGSFVQSGTGTTTLNAANSYSGGSTVNAGTLRLENNAAAGTGGISVAGGSLRIIDGVTLANHITITGPAASVVREVAADDDFTTGTTGTLGSNLGGINTVASILDGTNGASGVDLTMGFAASSAASNDSARRSDIFSITGTSSEPFVIQLTVAGMASDSFLALLSGGEWVAAGTNFYDTAWSVSNVTGDYGFDAVTGSVWAVVDAGGSFAAIPEPSTALAGLLLTIGLLRRRRAL